MVSKKQSIQEDEKVPAQEAPTNNQKEEQKNLIAELKELTAFMKPEDIESVEFEKDDETNFHVDFIHAATILRARNHSIPECDKLKTRKVAGNIIPAIVTTTAMIVGSLVNELFKIIQKVDKIELYKNACVNLSIPLFVFSEPAEAIKINSVEMDPIMQKRVKAIPEGHTKWDKVEMHGPMELKDFMEHLKKEYKLTVEILSYGNFPLYMKNMSPTSRMGMKIEEIVEAVSKSKMDHSVRALKLEIIGEAEDGVSAVVIPAIQYYIN